MTVDAPREPVRPWLGAVEAALSLTTVGVVLWLPIHHLGAYWCLTAECPAPSQEEIRTYRLLAGGLATGIVATFTVAALRRARWAFAWHVAVALAGAASAVLFVVPAVDWGDVAREDPPPPNPDYVPCYSGPPNDCPGG